MCDNATKCIKTQALYPERAQPSTQGKRSTEACRHSTVILRIKQTRSEVI